MAYLLQGDLTPPLYQEIINEITRNDSSIVDTCISSGIAEVKSYCPRFDLLKLFGNDTTDSVVSDEYLKTIVKDIACWHLIKMANPNVNIPMFRTAYEDAIKFLEKVMRGFASPDGWPLKPDDPLTTGDEGKRIFATSNIKRNNQW